MTNENKENREASLWPLEKWTQTQSESQREESPTNSRIDLCPRCLQRFQRKGGAATRPPGDDLASRLAMLSHGMLKPMCYCCDSTVLASRPWAHCV